MLDPRVAEEAGVLPTPVSVIQYRSVANTLYERARDR